MTPISALRPFSFSDAVSQQDDTARAAEEQRREQEALDLDSDRDGIPDETERWLGTSTFTDESGVDGRTDAGTTASVTRMERALERDHAALCSRVCGVPRPADTTPALGEEVAPFARSALGVRLAAMTDALSAPLKA